MVLGLISVHGDPCLLCVIIIMLYYQRKVGHDFNYVSGGIDNHAMVPILLDNIFQRLMGICSCIVKIDISAVRDFPRSLSSPHRGVFRGLV